MVAGTDSTRRLKAIMFTDIKGYSAMMGEDEARTVKAVLEHREIVRDCLKRHDGSEHETIGDAFVVLFDSVVNAVRCGAEIQKRLGQRNATLPKEEQVLIRIGIHLGDIIVQGDGIYGDGVNVAARVQDKADPGGISITEQVFLQIDGKIDFPMESVGKVELKNIRNPHSLYKVRLDGKRAGKRIHLPLLAGVLAGMLTLGAGGAWLALSHNEVPKTATTSKLLAESPPPVAAPPVKAAPVAVAPPAAAGDSKVAAGRKVAEAMAATGQARVELLRQALTLDPGNAAVQNMLASAMASAASAPAAAGGEAQAGGAADHVKLDHGPGKPAHIKTIGTGQGQGDDTKIKRSIVVE